MNYFSNYTLTCFFLILHLILRTFTCRLRKFYFCACQSKFDFPKLILFLQALSDFSTLTNIRKFFNLAPSPLSTSPKKKFPSIAVWAIYQASILIRDKIGNSTYHSTPHHSEPQKDNLQLPAGVGHRAILGNMSIIFTFSALATSGPILTANVF